MYTVIFMGSPDFALPALQALIDATDFDVKLVVSQPDKPQGRKQVLTPPAVKQLALQCGLEVFQPASLKTDEALDKLKSLSPDFIVVAAYGKILPAAVLDLPRYGCVNLHGSLLPKYRGAAPIQWSVINGDAETGVTTMLMDVGLDTGDILECVRTPIGENETAGELFDRLAAMCPELLLHTLYGLIDGTVHPVKQDDSLSSYAPMLSKENAAIDWTRPAADIHHFVCGLNPWPVAKTTYQGKTLKIFSGLPAGSCKDLSPGTLFVRQGALFAACGCGTAYALGEIQLEGAKRMSAADFLRGHPSADGDCLVSL